MVFKDIGAVFKKKTKNKKQKKNEKKQKQQRCVSPILASKKHASTLEDKQSLKDFSLDNFTKLYSISRGEMLTTSANHKPLRISSLENCCENSCIVPGLKVSRIATGPALPVPNEKALVMMDNIISID